jgi:hypothetical protein
MAHPADPAAKAPVFAHAQLSPDEADRLALMFRPSWELDDAPFTGAGTLSDADLRALQGGGGVRAEVRATALQAPAGTNGTHAPAVAAAPVQVAPSVIIDAGIHATIAGPGPQAPAQNKTMMGMPVPTASALPAQAPAPVSEAPRPPPSRPSQRPMAPNFVLGPPTPPAQPVVARPAVNQQRQANYTSSESYPAKSRMGLWIGLGGAAALIVGIGIWAVASGGNGPPAAPAATAEKPTEDKLSAVPPPPPVTATAPTATAAPPPAVTATAAPIPTAPATALPVAPPQRPVAAAPPPPPLRPAYPPPASAPPHTTPSRKNTIVHDVPF